MTLANTAVAWWNLNGYTQTISSLSGGGANGGNIATGGASLYVNQSSGSLNFAGNISGGSNFFKTGGGTLCYRFGGRPQRQPGGCRRPACLGGSLAVTTGNVTVADSGITNGSNGTLNIGGNAVLNDSGSFLLGNDNGYAGTVNQSGGTVNVTLAAGNTGFRIGHWPSETSYYNLSGGSLGRAQRHGLRRLERHRLPECLGRNG